jgi:hypothetical protein
MALARPIASEPLVEPTFGGMYQPLPPLVCGANVSADSPQPTWPPSTANPPVPWPVFSDREPIRAGNGFGLETLSATSAWPPGYSAPAGVPPVTAIACAVAVAAVVLPPPVLVQ